MGLRLEHYGIHPSSTCLSMPYIFCPMAYPRHHQVGDVIPMPTSRLLEYPITLSLFHSSKLRCHATRVQYNVILLVRCHATIVLATVSYCCGKLRQAVACCATLCHAMLCDATVDKVYFCLLQITDTIIEGTRRAALPPPTHTRRRPLSHNTQLLMTSNVTDNVGSTLRFAVVHMDGV